MRGLLVVGGLDPTGGAGITADAHHVHDVGVWALPIATAITVQTPDRFDGATSIDATTFTAGLEAAARTMDLAGVKTGLFWDARQIEYLAAFIRDRKATDPTFIVVVDPVLGATAPGARPDRDVQRALEDRLIPLADVVTPNVAELSALTDQHVTSPEQAHEAALRLVLLGAKAVYVKGVAQDESTSSDLYVTRHERHVVPVPRSAAATIHGSGCAVASRIAAHLAAGRAPLDACGLAAAEFAQQRLSARRGHPDARQALVSPQPLLSDAGDASLDAVQVVMPRLLSLLPAAWVAECGNNVAFAPSGATKASEVATLRQRIRLRDGRPHAPAAAHHAPTSHVARVALAAAQATGTSACALNLRHHPDVFTRAAAAGFSVGRFARADQPKQERSSVEWGTRDVLRQGYVDLVADDGGPGKEPMVRLLAKDPDELVAKLRALVTADGPTSS